MHSKWSLAGLLGVLFCWSLGGLPAQAVEGPRFDPNVMNADAPTPEQVTTINTTIKDYISQVKAAKEEDVAASMDALFDPLGKGGRPGFNQAYLTALEKNLPMFLGAGVPTLVRFNAMRAVQIMVGRGLATSADVIPLIGMGLADKQPGGWATVYWAARAAENLIGAGKLEAKDEKILATSLAAAVQACEQAGASDRESAWTALGRVNHALALNDAGAVFLLEGVKRRINTYLKDPSLSLAAENEGLTELYKRWVRLDIKAGVPTPAAVKDMAAITFKYLDMAGKFADTGSGSIYVAAPASVQPELLRVIGAADSILPWALSVLDPKATAPAPMAPFVAQRPPGILKVLSITSDWAEAISKPAVLNTPTKDLRVAVPKKG